MSMAQLQFYQNKFCYPHYSHGVNLTTYGVLMDCTPVGINLKSGTLRVKGDMLDFMSCNYLALTRDLQTIYAWIENVEFHTADSFLVSYRVDAWRTYKDKIDLGVQHIERRPTATSQRDPMLGSEQDFPDVSSHVIWTANANSRIFVVQVRPPDDEPFSTTPVQPSPYQFYVIRYTVNQWTSSIPLYQLLSALAGGAETTNLVTMYSIPYIDILGIPDRDLPVTTPSGTTYIAGWTMIDTVTDINERLAIEIPITITENSSEEPAFITELLRVEHSVQLVIPEAGIINIPDELLGMEGLALRQDIDLFSGASNYMLMSTDGTGKKHYYTQSARGSSVSSVPILSDPMDTYLSQNQNALTTSLIGDVASIAGGVAVGAGLAPITGGMSMAIGGGGIVSGLNGITNRYANEKDAGSKVSNPPAFLGTALVGNFNNRFWIVVTKAPVDNAGSVHSSYGYQYGKVTHLTVPSVGFIQTQGCTVKTTDGSVPLWAQGEINQIFNNGLCVHV